MSRYYRPSNRGSRNLYTRLADRQPARIPWKALAIAGAVFLVVAALVMWLFAPAFHGLLYGLVYRALPFWILLVVAGAVAGGLWLAGRQTMATLAGAILVCVALLYAVIAPVFTQTQFLAQIQKRGVEEVPDTTQVRYLPFEIARAAGLNSTTNSLVHLGEPEPVIEDELRWLIPREPNGLFNRLTRRQQGVLAVDPDSSVDVVEQPMTYGEGMALSDNWEWQAHRENYWSEKTNPYYVRNDDELLILSPYVEWGFDFPSMVPRWGGVLVIHPDGEIEDLSPQEARDDGRFDGERIYPQTLARRGMDAWAYQNGILNALFRHRDQTQLPEIQYTANQPPYLLPTDDGLSWVAGAEPHGSSYSLHTMFYVDAQTGVFRYREYGGDSNLIGPNRAINVVQSAFPNYQWQGNSEGDGDSSGNSIVALEPRPTIVDGNLWWMLTLTNSQFSSVTDTVMVNATGGNEVVSLGSYEEVQAFLSDPRSAREGSDGGGTPEEDSGGSQGQIDPSQLTDEQLSQLLNEAARRLEGER